MSSSQPFNGVEAGPVSLKEKGTVRVFSDAAIPRVEHLLAAPAPEVVQAPAERRFLPDIKQFIPTLESAMKWVTNNPFESAALALTAVLLIANGFWAAAVVGGILALISYSEMPKFFKWGTLASLVGLAFGFPQIAIFTVGLGAFYWLFQALRGEMPKAQA